MEAICTYIDYTPAISADLYVFLRPVILNRIDR